MPVFHTGVDNLSWTAAPSRPKTVPIMSSTLTAPHVLRDSAASPTLGLRRPPQNPEAEKALLGAIFLNNRAYERVSEFLRGDHFATPQHGRIFDACARLIERGQVADPITLKAIFDNDESLADMGGAAYLMELANSAVTIINAGEYGRIIHDLHLRRELIALGEDVVNTAHGGDTDEAATEQIESAEQRLYDLATHGTIDGGFQPFKATMLNALRMAEAAHKRDGRLSGVRSGFRDLDSRLGGLHPSDLLILAGRPSMGKTALATNIAFNAARAYRSDTGNGPTDGAVVAFFSLEMSAEQLATRILAEETRIPSDRIRRGLVPKDKFADLAVRCQEIQELPMFIDDSPALTISAMRTRARRLKRQHNLGMIVIDYLQLIAPPSGVRMDNRVQELSHITRGLKALAKELNVPVLALSQLSRAVEQRDDKRPQLSDLRESGTIEQDADVVMFIFRKQYYLERSEPVHRADEAVDKYTDRHARWLQRCEEAHNKAEVIIAKQRHGPIGTVPLFFEGEFTRFGDLDTQHAGDEEPWG